MTNLQVSKWIKFFKEAGIPNEPSTNYAIIFYDNRIQDDMLPDLTKEILRDMGISIMGDVIAILRHAKQVHAQAEREKAAQALSVDKDIVEKSKSTAASRMVDHWINNQKSSPGSRSPSQRGDSPFEAAPSNTHKKKLTIQASLQNDEPPAKVPARSLSDRFGSPSVTVAVKRKPVPSGVPGSISKSAPVKAKKIVTKPKNTATVTKPKSSKKQSVFDRLGQDPSEPTPASSQVKTVIEGGSSKKQVKSLKPLKTSITYEEKEKATGSVFSRLGGLQATATTITKAAVQPISAFQRQKPNITVEFDNEAAQSIDYTSHSVLQPATKKAIPVAKTTKGTKPVKQVKPVKRSVGLVADTGSDSKSVFARLGGKI